KMNKSSHLLTDAGALLARPISFALVAAFVALWLLFDHRTFDWHGVLTVLTLIMTLFIQRSEHRDMQATQAKLDELLRASGEARTDLKTLDEKEPEEVEDFRSKQGQE
ncbi:MAG: low affinity iron permease family protein, partial [Hyphomicrobium sp.]